VLTRGVAKGGISLEANLLFNAANDDLGIDGHFRCFPLRFLRAA
jgi:hypothetical protein